MMINNISTLNIIQQSLELEKTNDMIKCSISMGHALKMRELITEATNRVLRQKIPLLYETVKTGFSQYSANIQLNEKYIPMDRLARECGINVGVADHELIQCLHQLRNDSDDDDLWSLLPYAYGAIFTSKYWVADKKVSDHFFGLEIVFLFEILLKNSFYLLFIILKLFREFNIYPAYVQ